ncbi:MAG: DUF4249 domain-containing protein [Chitinophagales bacterium]|nr:DUF4249 domain-containing protein [Chitinophagales bacterium]
MFIFVTAGQFSCTRDLDIELPEPQKKLVLNGILTAGQSPAISVETNSGMHADSFPHSVKTARVILTERGGWSDTLLAYTSSDNYTYYLSPANRTIQQGKIYEIFAMDNKLPPVFAVTTVPDSVAFDATNLQRNKIMTDINNIKIYYDEFNLSFKDAPGEKNFYSLSVTYIDTIMQIDGNGNLVHTPILTTGCIRTSDAQIVQSSDIPVEDDRTSFNCYSSLIFSDKFIQGKSVNIPIQIMRSYDEYHAQNPVYKITLHHLSESYYQYLVTLNLQNRFRNNPFAEPVQVYNNIQNGLGIFCGKATSVKIIP